MLPEKEAQQRSAILTVLLWKSCNLNSPLIYCRLRVSSKLFIYSITYPSVWKMNPCLSLRCVFLFRMESADSWVWLQMRTAMQVTDIDSGTSLSIQALEQNGGGGGCRRKMLLRSTHNIQRCVRCQPPSLSHEATRELQTVCIFVLSMLGVTHSIVCLQREFLSELHDKRCAVVCVYCYRVRKNTDLAIRLPEQ